jgi:hypothetical protein
MSPVATATPGLAHPERIAQATVTAVSFTLVRRSVRGPLLADPTRGTSIATVGGTSFAVLLAFVIFAGFQTYNGAKTGAESEATAVLDMARTAALFPAAQRDELRGDLACYARAVIDQEWPAMRQGRSSPVVDGWIGAYRALFGRLDLRSTREQLAFQELLTEAQDRIAGRQQRLSEDTPTVPTPLWIALIFGACVAVALRLCLADPRERLAVQGTMVAAVAAVMTAGLLIVYLLDHPYQRHVGGIQPTAMRQTLAMVAQLEPALRPPCGADGRPLAGTLH